MQIIVKEEQQVTHITLIGRLDGVTMSTLEEQLLQLFTQGKKFLLFQMQELDYISSAGLRVMLLAVKKTKAAQGAVALCQLRSNVLDIFNLSGFSTIFQISATEAEALSFLQQQS